MNIFVIIVTYKGQQWYDRCFESLRQSTIPLQTIVVDNASNDGTVEYLKKNYPEIHLIESSENLGFGRANNLAMRYALDQGCDYVFLLNQDTWIKPDTIENLLSVANFHPECGLFSPMHLTADQKSFYMQIEDGKKNHSNHLLSDFYFQSIKDIYYFKYINAAAWLLPRRTLQTVGGFDPIFFLYGEDDNYLQRLAFHKLRVGLIPKAQIIHDHQKRDITDSCSGRSIYMKSRLVHYTNVLNDFSIPRYSLYKIWKILRSLLVLDPKVFSINKQELIYIWKNKKNIERSRKLNKSTGELWL